MKKIDKHNIYREANSTVPFKVLLMLAAFILASTLSGFSPVNAQVRLPSIPSNTQLSNSYEYDAEYIYRVNLNGSWLEDGALIAYVDGKIRGAQTASVKFTPTNTMVFKIRLFSNSASGEVITFRYYDVNNNKIYDITETQTFVADHVPDYSNPDILNAYCGPVGKAGTLVPADNAADLDNAFSLYWQPAENAISYSVYIWKDGDAVPATAYRKNIYGTSTYVNALEYGSTYRWYVKSFNQCGYDSTDVQMFTVRNLPDLVITSVTANDSVLTTDPFDVEFTIKNQGAGSTRSGRSWYNTVYISADDKLSSDDMMIGRIVCNYTLKSDSSYTQKITVSVPAGNAGDYYLLVKVDNYNNIPETDNDNNVSTQQQKLVVTAKPMPDMLVQNVMTDHTTYDPGDTIVVSWDVKNTGGADAVGGWTEKVSLISLSGLRVNLTGSPGFSGVLKQDSTRQRSFSFVVPEILNFSGEAYIEVNLYPSSQLIEEPGSTDNNKASTPNRILFNEKIYLTVPVTDIKEDYSGTVRCYVSRSGNTVNDLSLTLTASQAGQLDLPSSVTIPARSASGIFDLGVIDNSELDGSRTVTLTASAAGFDPLSKEITILDDEVPSLSVTLLPDTLHEGDTVTVDISRDLTIPDPTVVYLATDRSSQWSFPVSVTIPGNENSVTAKIVVTDDISPEIDQRVKLMASSKGLVTAEAFTVITDDDIPVIELEIANDTVSEGAGPYATWGIIRRTGSGEGTLRINISVDVPNAVYFPTSITLSPNEMSKKINIGVIDNALVDGFRDIKVSAAVYISSCGCSAPAASGGVVSKTMTIIDNDGPAFTLTVDQASFKEGLDKAGTLSVFRNTAAGSDLEVSLSVNDTSEMWLPATVTIPAGETTLRVPVKTKDDGVEDGNQMVAIKAEAPGFSPGIVYAYVTDINKADLELTDIELSEDSVIAGGFLRVQSNVMNNGFGTAPSGIAVKFYLSENDVLEESDSLIFEAALPDPIPSGSTVPFIEILPIPDYTGTYKVLAKVNPEFKVSELVYENNNASSGDLTILPSYSATASTDTEILKKAGPVDISGKAVMYDGSPAANADVDVYVISENLRRVINVTTDATGDYSTTFEPFDYETGHYIIGACYPGQGLTDEQDAFDIMGMERVSKDYFVWNIKRSIPDTGVIAIRNRSNIPLTNVTLGSDEFPEGCELKIDTIATLAGGATAELHYVVTGTKVTPGVNYIQFPLKATSDEDVSFEFDGYYFCQALQGHLESYPSSINTTMTKGKTRYLELRINNNGIGETGKVAVELPDVDFMSLVSPDTIDNILPGDTTVITLMLLPGEDAPLNLPFKGNMALHVSNGDDLSVPYIIEAVSEDKGNLKVDVVDVYTYNTDSAPHVSGAHVVLRHPYSGKIIGDGFTDSTGVFTVDSIPEGNYILTVEADKHEGYRNPIVIDPGRTLNKSVFLDFQAITYTWDVIETDIEDEYQIDLIMKFETNVPAPVVVMEMPKVMPQLQGDETYTFMVTLTNKGLITAEDTELKFPDNDPEYEWIFNFPKIDILAQQAVQVPVTMRRKDASSAQPEKNGSNDKLKSASSITSDGNCSDYAVTIYGFECGADHKWHRAGVIFSFSGRYCPGDGGGGDGWGGCCGGGGIGPAIGDTGGDYEVYSTEPSVTASTEDCDPCKIKGLLSIIGCLGDLLSGPVGAALSVAGCASGAMDGISASDVAGCVPYLGCVLGVIGTIEVCLGSGGAGGGGAGGGGGPPGSGGVAREFPFKSAMVTQEDTSYYSKLSPIMVQAIKDLKYVAKNDTLAREEMAEYFGTFEWGTKESFFDFFDETIQIFRDRSTFSPAKTDSIKLHMYGTDISNEEIDYVVNRWNRTMEAWGKGIYSPTSEYPDIIDKTIIDAKRAGMDAITLYALNRGYESVGDMQMKAMETMKEASEGGGSSVCASVTIKISQKLVMTREAFEGTLTIYNGHDSIPMRNIKLNLEVRNSEGAISNDLFQIETKALDILTGIDSTGVLDAGKKGSATILFIPEKGAAPTVPESYSFGGSFSYLDPFTNLVVTKQLMPVTLEVDPSPDLFLHYFMQRDILGDDALTENVVEPVVPAELAVMIENNGYGEARKVRIESAQPEIVDNKKGLAIHFALIGSNLNGQPRQLGLTNIDFGNIAPKSTAIGQWWFTSDLLGHFVDYKTEVTHLDSRGNPDLSLVSGAKLHELIRSIKVYGANDDGINDFLVNEVQDIKEQPDAIYLSQGSVVYDVFGAEAAAFDGNIRYPDYTNTLKVVNKLRGWNYVVLDDPGNGRYEIASITRNSDGQVIPPDNAWLTFVTLPDGKEPIYENKFHFVDDLQEVGDHEYTVVWKLKDDNPVYVVSIDGAPENFVTQQVNNITVKFNCKIDPATFTWEDMTLRLQGGDDIMSSAVVITKIDDFTYDLDLSALTTGNGYYVLTVETAEISDMGGNKGKYGEHVGWTQFLTVPAVDDFIGVADDTLITSSFDYVMVHFNMPVDEYTVVPERFTLKHNGTVVSSSLTVTKMDVESQLFKVSGIGASMAEDGEYTLVVDMPGIANLDGEKGLTEQTVTWTMDTTPPSVVSFTPDSKGGYDGHHYSGIAIEFSEPVSGVDISSIDLWKDGMQQPMSQVHFDSIGNNIWYLTQFRLLTYYEGSYSLKVNMENVVDKAGHRGSGVEEFNWVVDRSVPVEAAGLRITPDLGYSNTDNITSVTSFDVVMDVADDNVKVEVYRNDFGTLTLLGALDKVQSGEVSVPVTITSPGNFVIEVHIVNSEGNYSTAQIDAFVDQTAFDAVWQDLSGTYPDHPSDIEFTVSEKLMEGTPDVSLLKLVHNGNEEVLPGSVTIQKVSDLVYKVTGLDGMTSESGDYTLSLDLTGLHKYSSGLSGTHTVSVTWTIDKDNSAPVAKAGSSFYVESGKQYSLDASGSTDPDGDDLTYHWFPPDGITLDDEYSMSPVFTAPVINKDTVLTFVLLVSDGKATATAKVNIFYSISTNTELEIAEDNLVIYPNPCTTFFTAYFGNNKVKSIKLVDMSGAVLISREWNGDETQTIRIGSLRKGIYVVQIETDEKVINRKLLVK